MQAYVAQWFQGNSPMSLSLSKEVNAAHKNKERAEMFMVKSNKDGYMRFLSDFLYVDFVRVI